MATTQVNDTDHPPAGPPRRRIPMALVTGAFVVLILVLVVLLVVVKVTRGTTTVQPPAVTPAPETVVKAVTSVPAADFDAVGAPEAGQPEETTLAGQPPLATGGLPTVVFVGAEFCPYCAAERWAVVAALGRFGTFRHLGATASSGDDVFPDTPTFTFEGTAYRSRYVAFEAVERYKDAPSTTDPPGFPPLHGLDAGEVDLLRRYDGSSGQQAAVLPFVDVDDKLVVSGAGIGFSPALFQGLSMVQVADDLSQPSSAVAQAVLGAANRLSAAVCAATGGTPASVCESSGVEAGARRLGLP
ncbi:MAG TPA: DUF929 family protein [Acidimicrobiales bacterium]|nr:DUF929 family protein [Acidimicrobiales bacterium]